MPTPPYTVPLGEAARAPRSATKPGGLNGSVVMSWIGGTDFAFSRRRIGGAAATTPAHKAATAIHAPGRHRGTAARRDRTRPSPAAAMPAYAAQLKARN